MSRPIITETLRLPGNVNAKDAQGYLICRGATSGAAGAYVTRSGLTVAGRIPVTFAAVGFEGQLRARDGSALQLNPNQDAGSNDAITSPTGSVYEYRITIPGQQDWVRYLSVPDAVGPYRVDQILTANPAAIAPMSASSISLTPRASMLTDDTNAQLFVDEFALDAINDAAFAPGRRAYARLRRSGTAMVCPFWGDSVTNRNTTTDKGYQEVWRARMKSLGGFPTGGPGWRYASPNVESRAPNWTLAGGAAWQVDGPANASVTIPVGGTATLSAPTTLDHIQLVFCRTGDPLCSKITVTDSINGLLATIDPFDVTLGNPLSIPLTNRVYDKWWDSGSLLGAAQSRTITVGVDSSGGRTNGAIFVASNLLNGEGSGDFIEIDGGINGATTTTFTSATTHDELVSSTAGVLAAIEHIELGLNETDPAIYQAGLVAFLTRRKSFYPANQPPTFVLITSWAKTGRTAAQNAAYLRAVVNAAITVGGVAVFRGHDLWDFNTDVYGESPDHLHPGADAHYKMGHALAEFDARHLGVTAIGGGGGGSVTLSGDVSGPSSATVIGAGAVTAAKLAADVLELIRDTIGTALVAGTKTSVTVNDAGDTLAVNVAGLASTDLSDFAEAVDDRVAALAVAGTHTSWSYNDAANTLKVDVSGLSSSDLSDFTEAVQDVLGTWTGVDGAGLSVTYNDGANTYVLSVNVDGATIEISSDTLRLKDGGTTPAKLDRQYLEAKNGGKSVVVDKGTTGGAVTLDISAGNDFKQTANSNTTISVSNVPATGNGVWISFSFTQDGTGGRTCTLPAAFKVTGTIDTTAGKTSVLAAFTLDGGTSWLGSWTKGFA